MAITFRSAPEYRSVRDFVEHLLDDGREEYSHEDLEALNYRLRLPVREIRAELGDWGLRLAVRPPVRRTRGFRTSSHDRWFGPGSCPTHGGSGAGSAWIPATSFGE
jgi:hypothetical protein